MKPRPYSTGMLGTQVTLDKLVYTEQGATCHGRNMHRMQWEHPGGSSAAESSSPVSGDHARTGFSRAVS